MPKITGKIPADEDDEATPHPAAVRGLNGRSKINGCHVGTVACWLICSISVWLKLLP